MISPITTCSKTVIYMAFVLANAVFVSGFAASLPKQSLDQEAAKNIQKIALVETHEMQEYIAFSRGSSMFGGLIGGMAAGEETKAQTTQLTNAFLKDNFSIAHNISDETASALTKIGYQVERTPDIRELVDGKLHLDYAKVETQADAILAISITISGYMQNRDGSYAPVLAVRAELIGKNRKDRLFQEFYMYQMKRADDWIYFDIPPEYIFSGIDDLIGRLKKAEEGLDVGSTLISDRLAQDLKK